MSSKNNRLPDDRLEAFAQLWQNKMLGEYETLSGVGSTLMATVNLRRALQEFFLCGVFKSVLDAGCGDFNWMGAMDLAHIEITAIDIIEEIISKNRERYKAPNLKFEVFDITTGIPATHDLVICKDLFTHFPFEEIAASFNNIKKSGSRYIAISNSYKEDVSKQGDYYDKNLNSQCAHGYWRPLAFHEKPFYFHMPLWSIPINDNGKFLDIWELGKLPYLQLEKIIKPIEHNPLRATDFEKYDFFRKLCSLPFIQKIALYGSRARGNPRYDSDIDLMLYCNPQPSRNELLLICDIIDRADVPLEIDCKIFNETMTSIFDDPQEFADMQKRMITLYSR